MSLSIGIVGLPNVGKSSLFNLLTKKGVEAENYPFCTIDPNVGVVTVPDKRLDQIAQISKSKKIIPTTIEFVDIAGLVVGAHKGEGLGNQFLAHIRECDAICEVIRSFTDDNIIHVNGNIDPTRDRADINLELVLADLSTVQKRLDKVNKEVKGNSKEARQELLVLQRILPLLELGQSLRDFNFTEEELVFIKKLNLLSLKPILYLINTDLRVNDSASTISNIMMTTNSKVENTKNQVLAINIKLEEEILTLSGNEQKEYIKELGLEKSGLDKLIQSAYKLLDLETFFTTGPEETRAWTIKRGSKAPLAAGEIHSDFIKNFIRAEVINWKEFVTSESKIKAKELGLIRTEGKDYVIKDGDVCHFLINRN